MKKVQIVGMRCRAGSKMPLLPDRTSQTWAHGMVLPRFIQCFSTPWMLASDISIPQPRKYETHPLIT
ncbi:MAG: hypothetical protein CMJ19_23925 [Phycisphaeraceae bacterium]|nr:hypothetical protein [Phycisphaeraceae bacterium]